MIGSIGKIAKPIGFVLAIVFTCALFIDEIPPRSLTRTRMWVIHRRILKYAHENGKLPTELATLPEMTGYDNRLTDWWGNPIQFDVDAQGIATLRSKGGFVWRHPSSEGMPLAVRFPTKTPTGEWSDELVNFLNDD